MKHIETLLTSVGIPAEEATKIANLPEAEQGTFDPAPIMEKVKTNYRTQFKNDPAFFNDLTVENLPAEVRKKLESNQYGRAASITRDKLLKGLGFTDTEIADLTPEQKEKLELFVPAVAEKYAKSKSSNPQIQQELIEARKKIEEMTGVETTLKTKYEKEAAARVSSGIFRAMLISELSSIPGLKISPADIAKTAEDIVSSKYGYAQTGDFNIELRQKSNPEMKVLKDNSSQELSLKELLASIAKERKWVDEEESDEQKKQKRVKGTVGGGGVGDPALSVVAPHVAGKIEAKIKSEL